MIENWRNILQRAKPRPSEEHEGMSKGVLAVIDSVAPSTEKVAFVDYGGGTGTRVTHPYVSLRSWLRVMPEEGTATVATRRGDTAESEISYYWSGYPERRTAAYRQGTGYYRVLDLGEFEFSSYGLAQIWASRGGSLDLRGGITRHWLNDDHMEIGSKAPTYRRLLHDHSSAKLRAEERFGVAWRKGRTHAERKWVRENGESGPFAREYMRILPGGGVPQILVDHREGHVLDFGGKRIKSPAKIPLRSQTHYYDSQGGKSSYMLDDEGNSWELYSNLAKVGKTTRIPKGTFRVEVGNKIHLKARRDIEMIGHNLIVRVRDLIHLESDVAIKMVTKGMISLEASVVEVNGRSVVTGSQPI